MRWSLSSCLLLSITIAGVAAEWSWGNEKKTEVEQQKDKSTELLEGEHFTVAQEKSLETNETVLDGIVDELINGKQGRSLGGFDEVYGDPTIKEALDAGDDTEARNLIKDRLCTLGLIQVSLLGTRYFHYNVIININDVNIIMSMVSNIHTCFIF